MTDRNYGNYIRSYIRSYQQQLMQSKIDRQAEHRQQQTAIAQTAPINYVQTILTWWRSLPPETRQRPWLLEKIIAAAFTDPNRPPSGWRVGQALRRLGWQCKRDWSNAGKNRRYWLPPLPENDFDL